MKPYVIPEKGNYYWNECWFSKSYLTLPAKARDLLMCLLTELKKEKVRVGKREKWAIVNNGDVSFTESSFRKLVGCSKETYRRSIHQLIGRGLIELTYQGGNGQGDRSKYKVLAIREVPKVQQKWRNYPIEDWYDDIPRAPNNGVGKNTRWEKGTSGRNSKTTLTNDTEKDKNSPNKKGTKK